MNDYFKDYSSLADFPNLIKTALIKTLKPLLYFLHNKNHHFSKHVILFA